MSRLFVNRLTVIDFSYLHAERGLLGESWLADIELRGGLDEQGMVLDFGEVKKLAKGLIDQQFDHKLLVPARHPGLRHMTDQGRDSLFFPLASGACISHRAPLDACAYIDAEQIDSEHLARAIEQALQPHMPPNVDGLRIRLRPEQIDAAFYHYSHGLKHHCGNCQRIAHGHRSRLEILRDGKRDGMLEQEWAGRWRDSYIGTREDLAEAFERDGIAYYCFAYRAPQGAFELELPKDACYLIDTESTVENLAQHMADRLKAEHPESRFEVRAYEGVDKGAIGEA